MELGHFEVRGLERDEERQDRGRGTVNSSPPRVLQLFTSGFLYDIELIKLYVAVHFYCAGEPKPQRR